MHRQQRAGRHLVALSALALATVALPAEADARFDEDGVHITDDTAHTLRDGEFRLGIWKFEYGVIEELDLGTYLVPWFAIVPNLNAKWEIWHDETWSFAVKASLFWMDLTRFVETDEARLWVFPFEAYASWRFAEAWTWTVSPVFTKVALTGNYDAADFEGTAAVTNFQVASTLEWRVSDVVALLLHGRWLAYQDVSGSTTVSIEVDPYTTVEVIGAAQSDVIDVQNAASVSLSVFCSWDTFNMKLGAGYGNYSVPGVNFVVPLLVPFPEVDFFWRW